MRCVSSSALKARTFSVVAASSRRRASFAASRLAASAFASDALR